MNLHKKSNINQAFWIGLGSFFSFSLSLLISAILSRIFEKSEYGTYRQIIFIYNTLLIVFSAGLPRIYSYYLPQFPIEQSKDIVKKITKILTICGFIFSIFLYVFSNQISILLKNPNLAVGIKYFSPVPLFLLPTLGIEGIFATYKKTFYLAVYNIVTKIIMFFLILIPIYIYKKSLISILIGWNLASIVILIIANYFKYIPFKNIKLKKTNLKLKEIFYYSLPLVVASISRIAMKASDQFFISRFFGAEVFAEYSNGFIQLPFVTIITSSVATILLPLFSESYNKYGNVDTIKNVWNSALQKSAIIIYPILVFFIFNSKEIILLIYGDKYLISSIYFKIVLIINFFNIITLNPLYIALGKNKLYAKIHIIFAILHVFISYFVIIFFNNPIYLIIFSVTNTILLIIIAFYRIVKIINFKFFELVPLKKILKILILSIVSVLISKSINLFNINLIFIIFKNFAIYFIILLFLFKIFKIEFFNIVKNLVNFKN